MRKLQTCHRQACSRSTYGDDKTEIRVEAPKVGGNARKGLMPRLGGLEVSVSKDMKEPSIQTIDEVSGPPARGTIICKIRIEFRSGL